MKPGSLSNTPIFQVSFFLLISFFASFEINEKSERVFSKGITITINKSSPAIAALEDCQNDYSQKFDEARNETFLRSTKEPIVLTKPLPQIRSFMPSQVRVIADSRNLKELDFPSLLGRNGDLLSVQERKNQIRDFLIDSNVDLRNKDWREEVQDLVAHEAAMADNETSPDSLAKAKEIQVVRVDTVVARVVPPSPAASAGASNGGTNSAQASPSTSTPPNNKAKDQMVARNVPDPSAGSKFSFMSTLEKEDFPYMIEGDVRLLGGLGFSGSNIKIYWEYEGQERERAQIDPRTAHYSIRVEKLKGYIVAELVDDDGQLMGQAEVDLFDFPVVPYQESRIDQLNLEIRPVEIGLSLRLLSARSFGVHKIYPEKPKVEIDELDRRLLSVDKGLFKDQEIAKNSSLIVRASALDHWKTISTLVANGLLEIKMFPNKMVEALLQIAGVAIEKKQGIIWGSVKFEGKEVQGAEIDLADASAQIPVYFKKLSEFIDLPTKNLSGTDVNGMFAFVGLPSGVHAVRAKINGVYYPAQLVNVESETVSYVELNFSGMRSANVSIVNPFNKSELLPGTLSVFGADLDISINGSAEESLKFPRGTHPSLIEVDAGEANAKTRVFADRDARAIEAITISKAWLAEMAAAAGVSAEQNSNVVVGFVADYNFDLLLSEKNQSDVKVLFFNSEGKPIAGNSGIAGGGFIIFNADEVLQTIAVLSTEDKSVSTKIVYPEKDFVSTLSFE